MGKVMAIMLVLVLVLFVAHVLDRPFLHSLLNRPHERIKSGSSECNYEVATESTWAILYTRRP